jgi:hypothetical protein
MRAKSSPILGLTSVWRRPAWVISMGSSAVQILMSGLLMCGSGGSHCQNQPVGLGDDFFHHLYIALGQLHLIYLHGPG